MASRKTRKSGTTWKGPVNVADPISFYCAILADPHAPLAERRNAALTLKPYYHPELAKMGPLLERFLGPWRRGGILDDQDEGEGVAGAPLQTH
jgi:hypothetical protein